MCRTPSRPIWNRPPRHAFPIACIALLALAPPAHAGIGDALKKAKDKALKTAGQKVAEEAPPADCKVEFDAVVLELTGDRVERILATFKAAGEAGAGRPALVEKLNRVNDERNALDEKHGEAIRETQRKRGDVETCYHDGYREAQDRRTQEYAQRALTDPELLKKFARAAQENNAAAAKGDTAALRKATQIGIEEMSPTREDSAQVRQSCGPLPPRSAAEQRLDALAKEATALYDQIARIDEKVAQVQAKQGGMDLQQWAMALERIQMYLSAKQSKSSAKPASCGFSKAEVEALEKNLEQLRVTLG